MNKKWKKTVLLLCVMTVMFLLPVSVQAKPSEKAVKKLYNQYMANSSCTWFRMLDINQDGVKELITSRNKAHSWDADEYFIYMVRGGKVTYVGKVMESSAYGGEGSNKPKRVFYNKSLKSIGKFETGAYSIGSTLFRMKDFQLKERLSMGAIYNRYRIFWKSVNGGKEEYYKTEAAYDKNYNTYFKKGCKKYALVKNTAANRKKYLS